MKLGKLIGAAAIAAAFATPALAQTTGTVVQRNVTQQERIEQGLQSGQLTTREAAKLEGEESRIDKMESRALKDGKLSPDERARIDRAQNQVSRDIYREKHDAQVGNPNSPSSQRMQADVQRNINQQQRIEQGVSQARSRTARSASSSAARRATTRCSIAPGATATSAQRAAPHPERGEPPERADLPREARRADEALKRVPRTPEGPVRGPFFTPDA